MPVSLIADERQQSQSVSLKAYFLDTSTTIHDPECLFRFQDNHVFIPFVVLHELDGLRKSENGRGICARQAIRLLESIRESSPRLHERPLPEGGRLTVVGGEDSVAGAGAGRDLRNDELILGIVQRLAHVSNGRYAKVALVTKDIGMRVNAAAMGIDTENYESDRRHEVASYTGVMPEPLAVDGEAFERFRDGGFMPLPDALVDMADNQFVLVRHGRPTLLARRIGRDLRRSVEGFRYRDIRSRNLEQSMALDLLCDRDVALVALLGPAGVGKTILALAAGLRQAVERDAVYDHIICMEPIIPVGGRDIGYLPGDKIDKLRTWLAPYFDNLAYIGGYGYPDQLIAEGVLELEAMTFIRGRSIANSWVIIDEAQNLSPKEIKTVLTRAGEGAKLICLADMSQIDTPYIDRESSGMAHMMSAFRGQRLFGMVELKKSERSDLSTMASQLL